MAIARRRRPLVRQQGDFRDASLFVVATEGRCTEPHYLKEFQGRRIKVLPLPCKDGRSSPEGVFDEIRHFRAKYQIGGGDRFWIVVDRDQWRDRMFSAVHAECRRSEVTLLVSNPFFEVWLALHFEDHLPDDLSKISVKRHLRSLLGSYSKGNYPLEDLIKRVPIAIRRARELDVGANEIWPDPPGSRVYLLMEEVLGRR